MGNNNISTISLFNWIRKEMNPVIHSENSVRKWGGKIEDYLPIHKKMDCSKSYISDNRHRCLTHTMFWINEVMICLFGDYIVLDNDKKVSVKDICEKHILEDYRMKFIPTPQDFIQEMNYKPWMQNGLGFPPSATLIFNPNEQDGINT
ncbi:MAG: hypothetical protein HC917_06330 [Richelia sp. SM2_1_7]|nr:hypothetical protein [Richelia sp. SM2_1_7]